MLLHAGFTILAGLIGFFLSEHFNFSIINVSAADQLSVLGTTVQVSVSMMGFMLAALAILASISDKPLVKNMGNMGHYRDLLLSLFTACSVYMFSFLISGSVLILGDYGFHWKQVLFGSLCSNIVATIQIGWKFWKVLSNLNISN